MRFTILLLLLLVACNNNKQIKPALEEDIVKNIPETLQENEAKPETSLPKTYANKRFKDVTVEEIGQGLFLVRGQGQIFESSFNWVVEDGQEELKKGFEMTDAGAPAWGQFEFEIKVYKKRENSTLTLIIFESSPKDGSRQYELPISLY